MSSVSTEVHGSALVLMCGRAFSGKSTMSREIAGGLDAEIVSLDAINEERGLIGGQGIPVEEWVRTNDEATRRVLELLEAGNCVVVDDTSSLRFLRDNWRATARDAGAAFALVYVDTPENVVLERLKRNREQPVRNDVSDAVMEEHIAGFEPPERDEEYVTASSFPDDVRSMISAVQAKISAPENPGRSRFA
jgi:predicted kinase